MDQKHNRVIWSRIMKELVATAAPRPRRQYDYSPLGVGGVRPRHTYGRSCADLLSPEVHESVQFGEELKIKKNW